MPMPNIKRKLLRCGNIRILFTINKHLYLYLYIIITYDYILLHSMTRYRRAPLGPPFWGASLGITWYLVPRPCSLTPQNRMICPPPSPYHWARLASAGSAKPGGGGKRSVCNWKFTHVTHIVKLFMRVKYIVGHS